MLLFSFVGLLLLRLDDRRLLELLFQLPPPITRDSTAVFRPDIPGAFKAPAPPGASPNSARAPHGPPTPAPRSSAQRDLLTQQAVVDGGKIAPDVALQRVAMPLCEMQRPPHPGMGSAPGTARIAVLDEARLKNRPSTRTSA